MTTTTTTTTTTPTTMTMAFTATTTARRRRRRRQRRQKIITARQHCLKANHSSTSSIRLSFLSFSSSLLLLLLLSLLSPLSLLLVSAGKSPCHGAAKFEPSDCTVVTLPSGLCSACKIGDYFLSGDFQGEWVDCEHTYHVEDKKCLASLKEYVNLNPCDIKRKEALEGYLNPESGAAQKDYHRQVLDFFAYAICENPCDCVPQVNADRDVPAYDVHRGNCQSHPYFDVCSILPDISLIRLNGTADDSATMDPMCPLVGEWLNSPAAERWGSNPNTTVDARVEVFLDRFMEATEILTDLAFYQSCFDLELTQSRIEPVGGVMTNQVIQINSGSNEAIEDAKGRLWTRDKYVTGGKMSATNRAIAGTVDDFIYQYERWGSFTYDIAVSNGPYHVVIHLAEITNKNLADGKRVFDIQIEGGQVLWTNVDIYQLAGGAGFTAVELKANVTVSDRLLSIDFIKGLAEQPKCSGIVVVPMLLYQDYVSGPRHTSNPSWEPTRQPTTAAPVVNTTTPFPPSSAPSPAAVPTNTNTDTVVYRINAGETVADKQINGVLWLKDQYYTGGKTSSHGTPAIANTTLDAIYHKERWGQCTYNLPVSHDGEYRVVIHLAELTGKNQASGKRIFTIQVESQVTFADIDIYDQVGGYTAYLLTADVTVVDGYVTIQFLKSPTEHPKVSGIEVFTIATAPPVTAPPAPAPGTDKTIYINAGAKEDQQVDGILWLKDQYVSGGKTAKPTQQAIANTTADAVFHLERWGACTYNIPVEPTSGNYEVTLLMAEVTGKNQHVGKRIFTINVESQVTFSNIDIYKEVGGYKAYSLQANVSVSDGAVTIQLVKGPIEHPKISGLIVRPSSSTTTTTTTTPTLAPTAAPPPSIYINAGSSSDTTVNGILWLKDQYFSGGRKGSQPNAAIAGTTADVIYQKERWGDSTYQIPLAQNGAYELTLHFAENNGNNQAPNKRLFNVWVQNQLVLDNVDIYQRAGGGYTAWTWTHTVQVVNGVLTIEFVKGSVEEAKICGIQVVPAVSTMGG